MNAIPKASATLDAWAQQYRGPLLKYFWKHSRRARTVDVEDMVQDVFLRLANRADIETIEQPERYLFTTANSVLKDRHRRGVTRAADAHVPITDTVEAGFSPERIALGQESVALLIRALLELPERTRTAFVLYHFDEFSHAQIGCQLGMAVSTVEKHMARANRHLMRAV